MSEKKDTKDKESVGGKLFNLILWIVLLFCLFKGVNWIKKSGDMYGWWLPKPNPYHNVHVVEYNTEVIRQSDGKYMTVYEIPVNKDFTGNLRHLIQGRYWRLHVVKGHMIALHKQADSPVVIYTDVPQEGYYHDTRGNYVYSPRENPIVDLRLKSIGDEGIVFLYVKDSPFVMAKR